MQTYGIFLFGANINNVRKMALKNATGGWRLAAGLKKCNWQLATGGWLFVLKEYLEDQNGDRITKTGERKREKEERTLEIQTNYYSLQLSQLPVASSQLPFFPNLLYPADFPCC
jgi:hypothetical protein